MSTEIDELLEGLDKIQASLRSEAEEDTTIKLLARIVSAAVRIVSEYGSQLKEISVNIARHIKVEADKQVTAVVAEATAEAFAKEMAKVVNLSSLMTKAIKEINDVATRVHIEQAKMAEQIADIQRFHDVVMDRTNEGLQHYITKAAQQATAAVASAYERSFLSRLTSVINNATLLPVALTGALGSLAGLGVGAAIVYALK